jgi:hypothetical protein
MSRHNRRLVQSKRSKSEKGRGRREDLIVLSGSRCILCQYDGIWALQFHHFERKRFTLNVRTLGMIDDMELILSEWRKCILLCSNCHLKYHQGGRTDDVEYAVELHKRWLQEGYYNDSQRF